MQLFINASAGCPAHRSFRKILSRRKYSHRSVVVERGRERERKKAEKTRKEKRVVAEKRKERERERSKERSAEGKEKKRRASRIGEGRLRTSMGAWVIK